MEQPVKDKAPKPQGLMPKNLQAMVIAGLAFLMVAVMALTGRKAPQPVATPAAMAPPPPPPVDEAKILAFRNSIQKQQNESDADLERALVRRQAVLAGADPSQGANPYQPGTYPPGAYPPGTPPPDPVKEDEKRRRYQSLFADNVALTYRKDATGMQPLHADVTAPSVPPAILAQEIARTAEQELERQAKSATPPPMTVPAPAQPQKPPETPAPAVNPGVAKPGEFNSSSGKTYVLFEGTVIEALLVNRLDGSFPLGGMSLRYLVNWSPWLYAASRDVYGNTTPWVRGANTGVGVPPAYNQATVPLQVYNPAILAAMPPPIQQNLQSQTATLELRDGASQTALQTIGDIRANSAAASAAVANVQADSFSGEGFMNNQVTVLNKVNATGVLGLQTQQDTNKLLISILEQQTIAAKHLRDAQAESINAEVYRQTNGQALDQQLTGGIQAAIANFTIP